MTQIELTDRAGAVWCAVWRKALNMGLKAIDAAALADEAQRAATVQLRGA